MSSEDMRRRTGPRVSVGGLGVDAVSSADVVAVVDAGWADGCGGMIVTPNVDIWLRARRDQDCADLISRARLVVADGMPLIWASRVAGRPLPERVAGSGLVETLSALAARRSRSVYLIGGGLDGAVDRAAAALVSRYPGLSVSGTSAPPFGFDRDPAMVQQLVDEVTAVAPDLVLVGLGFPRQERLAEQLLASLPTAWLLGCGAGVEMAAGDARRAPLWAQSIGAEWLVRLAQEPRRLAHRYLVDDLPAAVMLLSRSLMDRSPADRRHRERLDRW